MLLNAAHGCRTAGRTTRAAASVARWYHQTNVARRETRRRLFGINHAFISGGNLSADRLLNISVQRRFSQLLWRRRRRGMTLYVPPHCAATACTSRAYERVAGGRVTVGGQKVRLQREGAWQGGSTSGFELLCAFSLPSCLPLTVRTSPQLLFRHYTLLRTLLLCLLFSYFMHSDSSAASFKRRGGCRGWDSCVTRG